MIDPMGKEGNLRFWRTCFFFSLRKTVLCEQVVFDFCGQIHLKKMFFSFYFKGQR